LHVTGRGVAQLFKYRSLMIVQSGMSSN
jgi:hypothetical protein